MPCTTPAGLTIKRICLKLDPAQERPESQKMVGSHCQSQSVLRRDIHIQESPGCGLGG